MKIQDIRTLVEPIIVVKILEVAKHPNADKLKLVKIDMGEFGTKTCITGAPNISEESVGSFVPYLGVGHTIPGYLIFDNETVVLGKRMLRGIESDSMLLSEYEIGLSKSHEGLLILNESRFNTQNLDDLLGKPINTLLTDEDFSEVASQHLIEPEDQKNPEQN